MPRTVAYILTFSGLVAASAWTFAGAEYHIAAAILFGASMISASVLALSPPTGAEGKTE